MAIGDGKYIAIEFDRDLIGDVTGLLPTPILGYVYSKIDLSLATASALNYYSSTYAASKAIDSDTSTYWRGTTIINWLETQLSTAKCVTKFRLYMGGYYVSAFTFSGSNDGTTWTQIGGTLTGASSTTGAWYEYEVENSEEYLYYRIDTLTGYSTSRVYIYEFELYETVPIGNEGAFTVTAQEYSYVPGGDIGTATYPVASVHALTSNSIALEFDSGEGSIINAFGGITVAYSGGNLQGEGGPVADFEISFTPTDLVPKPDQNDVESISITNISIATSYIRIYYTNTADQETGAISISGITVLGTLTNVDDI